MTPWLDAIRDPDRLHADDWVWITPEERDALLDIAKAAQAVVTAAGRYSTDGVPTSTAARRLYDALCAEELR